MQSSETGYQVAVSSAISVSLRADQTSGPVKVSGNKQMLPDWLCSERRKRAPNSGVV